jgi:hypothetical protein
MASGCVHLYEHIELHAQNLTFVSIEPIMLKVIVVACGTNLWFHGHGKSTSIPLMPLNILLWTESTSTGCNQWLSLAEMALKVPHAGRNYSLMANTSRCGEGIQLHPALIGCHLWAFFRFVSTSNGLKIPLRSSIVASPASFIHSFIHSLTEPRIRSTVWEIGGVFSWQKSNKPFKSCLPQQQQQQQQHINERSFWDSDKAWSKVTPSPFWNLQSGCGEGSGHSSVAIT